MRASLAGLRRLSPAVAACALWAAACSAWAAGTIEAARGGSVVSAFGEHRPALSGSRVQRGETITLGDAGLLHVQLDDGARLALRAASRVTVLDIRADGGERDRLTLQLHQGGLRVLTGWIGRVTPAALEITVPEGIVRVRGGEIQIQTVDAGPRPGTLVFAADSVADIDTPAGSLQVPREQAARLVPVGPPVLLAVVPNVFPSATDRAAEAHAADHEERVRAHLAQVRRRFAFDGGVDRSGRRRIGNECAGPAAGPSMFDDFVAAYESGDAARVEQRLAHSLVGRQGVIDALVADSTRRRQLRFHFTDTQYQCGPDLTIINTTWEKRFIDGVTFAPGLQTGRVSVLMHRGQGQWRLVAFSGDNPFTTPLGGTGGNLARLAFGPVLSLAGVGPLPSPAPVAIDVTDPDMTGRGSIRVQVVSNRGDAESFTVPEIAPGRFLSPTLTLASGPPVPGDNVLQVTAGTELTLRYADTQPGNNRPATVLTATLVAVGATQPGVDTTPDPFGFAAITGAAPGSVVRSGSVTITGINAPATVTVAGGAMSIGGSAFSTAPATISAGQSLQLQVTSSATPGTVVTVSVNVGGVSAVFAVTTAGGAVDTTPDPFTFAAATGVAPNNAIDSSVVTITGINAPAPVTVAGGRVSIGGGAYRVARGPTTAGQSLRVRVLSSALSGATVSATVTVGGVSAVFAVTTAVAADTTPDPFAFAPASGAPGALVTSNPVVISGINAPAPVTVGGGEVSIAGGAFSAAGATITNAQTLQVRGVAGALNGAVMNVTALVGGVAGVFTITTVADLTPDPFVFMPQTAVRPGDLATSNTVTVTGINAPASVSIVNGSHSINGAAFTTAPGTIGNGQTLTLRVTAAATENTATSATVTVGTASASFTATTWDLTPNPFSLQPATPVIPCPVAGSPGVYNSATVVIGAIDAAAPVSIVALGAATLARYSINGGPLTATPGTILNGQTLQVQVNVTCPAAGPLPSAPVANLSVGGFSVQFSAP